MLKKSATALLALLLVSAPAAMAATVTDPGTGLIWRQLTATMPSGSGLSWDQVATVCSAENGKCSNKLGDVDYTGWIWASIGDVNRLFADFGAGDFKDKKDPTKQKEKNSDWAKAFFKSFDPTFQSADDARAEGWTRDKRSASGLDEGSLPFMFLSKGGKVDDEATTEPFAPARNRFASVGVWLYQDPAAVPEPATYALMLAGLGVLGFAARRRAR